MADRAVLDVEVAPVADAPVAAAAAALGAEDGAIALDLRAALVDADGSETLTVSLLGVPAGATLSAGTRQADGSWQLAAGDLPGLTLTPPRDFAGTLSLTLRATSTEAANGATATTDHAFTVQVVPLADAPVVQATAATGNEDSAIPLDLRAGLADTDGSETLSVSLLGVPPGATLSAGTRQADGSWQIAAADLPGLSITPPRDFAGTLSLTLRATSTEAANGATATTDHAFTVQVVPVADAPVATAAAAAGAEDTAIPLDLRAALTDTDGSEALSVSLLGVPAGATLSAGTRQADGTWQIAAADLPGLTLTPPRDVSGTLSLTLRATSTEAANGAAATTDHAFTVRVTPVADAPMVQVAAATGNEDTAIPLDLRAALADADGSETLSVTLLGVPSGATLSAGTRLADGTWQLAAGDLPGLSITPPRDFAGTLNLTLRAISTEATNGAAATIDRAFTVQVTAVADAPVVQAAAATGDEDSAIPLDLRAALADTDGSETLSVSLLGVPPGATLSAGTRLADGTWQIAAGDLPGLSLTPPPDFAGTLDLTLRATSTEAANGASATTDHAFAVQVTAVADAPVATAMAVTGDEDTAIPLDLRAALTDSDGSETLSVSLLGVPAGAMLSAGTRQADGTWQIAAGDLPGLTLTPPRDFAGTLSLTLRATSTEAANGAAATTDHAFTVQVTPVADAPLVHATQATGDEDTAIPLDLRAALADTDGSETLSVSLLGVPAGAMLSAGMRQADGSWQIAASDLPGLTLTPSRDFAGTLSLTLRATSTEAGNGANATVDHAFTVQVVPVADAPVAMAAAAAGNEDSAIPLDLRAGLADTDGSETLSVSLLGVPPGATLSAGTRQADGSWQIAAADLPGLSITPPRDFAGTLSLTLRATSTEAGNGATATTDHAFTVQVMPVADTPVATAMAVTGDEDTAIPLDLRAALADTDGSEALSVSLLGVPAGATLSAGTRQADGTWQLAASDLPGLTLTPPRDVSGTLSLTLRATSTEAANGATATTDHAFTVRVTPVADAPLLQATPAMGAEDGAIPLDLAAALTDTDGSESLARIVIAGLPAAAVLSAGSRDADGTWTLTPAEAAHVTLTPPADWSGTLPLHVTAVSREAANGAEASTTVILPVQVAAVADAPALQAAPATGDEDTAIALDLRAALTDTDGSETLTVSLLGVPAGATLSAGTRQADGSWQIATADLPGLSITPPRDFAGTLSLTLRATSTEAGNGATATTDHAFTVQVVPVADTPVATAAAATGAEDTAIPLDLRAALTDTDGSEALSVSLLGLPAGATLSAGTRQADGSWQLAASDLPGLSITPPRDFAGTLSLTLRATSTEAANGATATTDHAFTVQVTPVADAPVVQAAAATGDEDSAIPLDLRAALADADGSETLSVTLLGVPSGATLSAGTRQADGTWQLAASDLPGLTLTPPRDFAGTLNLTLRATSTEAASGASATIDRAFTVQVTPVADAPVVLAAAAAGDEDSAIPLDLRAALADTDGSETLSVSLLGIPAGATLSAGTRQADGTWQLAASDLPGLTLTPPRNFAGTLSLTLRATSTEAANGATATTDHAFAVEVTPVADAPAVMAAAAAGDEDTAIPLDLRAVLMDTDGSETLAVSLLGVPAGAMLSAGTQQADGSWRIAAADLPGLTLTPPRDFAGTLSLTLRATSTEAANGAAATTNHAFTVQVAPVADQASIGISGAGEEDRWIAIRGSVATTDIDGSEQLGDTVIVSGVPAGAVLNQGTQIAPGRWEVARAGLEDGTLAIRPPADSDDDITLRFAVQTTDGTSIAITEVAATIVVRAVSDTPTVQVADLAGQEDTPIPLAGLGGALTDTDGSETLSFVLTGVPADATLSAGTRNADGSWSLTPAELAAAALTPPANFSGSLALTLTAVATEAQDGAAPAQASASFTVTVDPVADDGTITASATGQEDTDIPLRPDFATPDADGSETWSALTRVGGVPAGAVLSHGTEVAPGIWDVATADLRAGTVTIRPPADSDADFALSFTATLTDTGNGTSVSRIVTGSAQITVQAVADAPVVSAADVAGLEDQPIALDLAARLTDTDGSERLDLVLVGVPAGATLSAGTRNGDGTWTIAPGDLPGLAITPPRDFSGSIALTLRATATDHESSTATTIAACTVDVAAVADAPTLRVGPAMGAEDSAIALRISGATTDIDGSEQLVGFRILGLPAGAVLRAGGQVLHPEADGSVLVDAAAAPSLTVTPPQDSDAGFTLRIAAIAAEPNGSRAESPLQDLSVRVGAVADLPVWVATSAAGQEDTAIPLGLPARLADTDGSETLTFLLTGLPAGAVLNVGTYTGPGAWSLTAAEAAVATVTPPRDFAGTFQVTLTAITQEANGGSQAVSTLVFPIHVAAVVDAADWTATAAGREDQSFALDLRPPLPDADGSEHLVGSARVSGIPAGAVLRLADGSVVPVAGGACAIAVEQLPGLTITMPHDSDVAARLAVTVTVEDTGGVRAEVHGTVTVDPVGVADLPVLATPAVSAGGHASQDPDAGWVPLHITASLADQDGSETLHAWVRDVPQGAVLSAGIPAGDGLWRVPIAALPGLALRPPAGFGGGFTLRVTAIASEREGDAAIRTETLAVTIAPPAAAGTGGAATDPDGATWSTAPAPSSSTPGTQAAITGQTRDLVGGSGNDTLAGHTGETRLWGGTGDDVLDGHGDASRSYGDGHDEEYGGSGNDTLVFDSKADLLNTRKIYGDAGFDTIRLGGAITSIVDSDLTSNCRDVQGVERIEFLTASAADLTVGAGFQAAFGAAAAIEAVASAAFTLHAAGSGQALTVLTGAGADTILTGGGNDLVDAGAGSDSIATGAGNDTIEGGAGGDSIDGGAGTDHLVYRGNRADYVIAALASDAEGFAFSITSKSGAVDRIRNVEVIDFADRTGQTPAALAAADAPRVLAAQAPALQVHNATTLEDQGVVLDVAAALADSDGGREVLGIRIDGVPSGARLSAGEQDPLTGAWVLQPSELAGLRLTPPANFDGRITLTVRAVAAEATGDLATTAATLRVDVTAVADGAAIAAAPEAGVEDRLVPLHLSVTPADADGSERVTAIILSGLPAGAAVAPATGVHDNGDGTWTVAPEAVGTLRIAPPPNAHGDFTLTVTATTQEAANGATATTSRTIGFSVAPVPDAPLASAADVAGHEDRRIPLSLDAALVDTDGSEALSVVISGLPAGTILSAGVNNGDGSWTLTPAELPGLMLTPPGNWSGSMALTMQAHALERSTGEAATTTLTFHVAVAGVADTPLVDAVTTASGSEDRPIGLDIIAQLADRDGSETLVVLATAVPAGARFSSGTANADGSWTIPAAALPGLTFTPPPNFSGTLRLDLAVTAVEADGSRAMVPVQVTVTVEAVADAPLLAATDATGAEDAAIPLDLRAALADADGSETLAVTLLGLPAGATLSAGTRQWDGSWQIAAADLPGLSLTPPRDFAGTLQLTLRATSTEAANADVATTDHAFAVQVTAVADAPVATAAAAAGDEDTVIPLDLRAALTDTDGSETLSVSLLGLPAGATLSAGTRQADGSWQIAAGDLPGLSLTPPRDFAGTLHLTLRATSTEAANGASATTDHAFTLQVTPVSDAPLVQALAATGQEDTAIPLDLRVALADTDGSEALSVSLLGVPDGASLSAGTRQADGSWQLAASDLPGLALTPPQDFAGTLTLTLRATSTEAGNGASATTDHAFTVDVAPVADAPLLHASPTTGEEDTAIPLDLGVALADTDGSESIAAIRITGLPPGFSLSAGSAAGDGEWSLQPADLPGLHLTAPQDWNGTVTLTLEATTRDGASSHTATRDVSVTLAPVNDAPVLDLAPAPHAAAGQAQAAVLAEAGITDVDSPSLSGATITLTGAGAGDRLAFAGYTLVQSGGHTLLADTGIEVATGADGQVTLSGRAPLQVYERAIEALSLESGPSGLASGTRSIGITLHDDAGAAGETRVVAVTVDPPPAPPSATPDALAGPATDPDPAAAAAAQAAHDVFVVAMGGGIDHVAGTPGDWTETIQVDGAGAPGQGSWVLVVDGAVGQTVSDHAIDLSQPASGHIQFADGSHVDFAQIERVTW
nr:Ig-like domain-containing protein [Paracraurococcus ruber]